MELLSTVESLSHHLEWFADQIDEIGSWIFAWDQDPRIKANITETDFGMTKKACLTIIVNAQAVVAAIDLIETERSADLPTLMSKGIGMEPLDWIPILDGYENAGCSPAEYQLRVVLKILSHAKERIRQFMEDKLYPVVLSEELGPQARLGFQHYVGFHREHMLDTFLMLQGLLVHGLDRRFADLPVLIYRIEQLMSMVKSIVLVSSEGLRPDHQNGVAPDISAWALPKQ